MANLNLPKICYTTNILLVLQRVITEVLQTVKKEWINEHVRKNSINITSSDDQQTHAVLTQTEL
jgi:hypothetical protein